MGTAGFSMPALADIPSVFHQYGPDRRIWPRQAFRAASEVNGIPHPLQIGF
jgi:hypothetical protein